MRELPVLVTLVIVGCLWADPALAGNKFKTIGGGVAGSPHLKLEYIRPVGYAFGVFFLVGAILSLSPFGHRNAATLNYSTWRRSAVVLLVLSAASFAIALFV